MREITDARGQVWRLEIASHGATSEYLNPKVHRPVVQFSCTTQTQPRRYAPLPTRVESLDELGEADLLVLLERAKVH